MANVEAKLKSTLLAIILLLFAVRATSAGIPYATYPGTESRTAEPIGMRSRCGGYPYTVVRKLIPCRSLRFAIWLAPPPPAKNPQKSQQEIAPPPPPQTT